MTAPLANIGPKGCRRRGTLGWVWLALAIAYVVVLAARDAASAWYAAAIIPFFMGTLGYFQAREQTCVFLAAVGQRNLDGGAERITDASELTRVRAEAWRVWFRAAAVAAALTLVAIGIAAFAD